MMVYQVSPTMTMDTIRDKKENLEVQPTDALMNCQKKTLLMSNTNDFWMDSRSINHTWTNIEGVLFPS